LRASNTERANARAEGLAYIAGLEAQGQAVLDAAAAQDILTAALQRTNADQIGEFMDILGGNELKLFNEDLDELGPMMYTIGGRTSDQNRLLREAQDEYKSLGKEISDMAAAPELYGLSTEEAAKKTQELIDRQGELIPLMDRLGNITGTASMGIKEATLNEEALNEAFFESIGMAAKSSEEFDKLDGIVGNTAEQMAIMGGALGVYNEEQLAAVLRMITLNEVVGALGTAIAEGTISFDAGRDALYDFAAGEYETAEQAINAAKEVDLATAAADRFDGSRDLTLNVNTDVAMARIEAVRAALAGLGANLSQREAQARAAADPTAQDDFGGGGGGSGQSPNQGDEYDQSGNPPRAIGGPVVSGHPYLVGETGPEMFVPKNSGNIIPNNQLGGGSGSVVINISGGDEQRILAAVNRALEMAGLKSNNTRRTL